MVEMLEYMLTLMYAIAIVGPAVYYCKYILDGKREIKKYDLIIGIGLVISFPMLWMIRLVNTGAFHSSVLEFCFWIIGMVEIYVYFRSRQ